MTEKLMEIFKTVDSSPKGLSSDDVKVRLEIYGYNEIKEEEKISEILRFLSQFNSPLIYILIASGIVTLMLNRIVDTAIIFAVVLISAVIGYLQEREAKKTIDALRKLVEVKARVLRDGKIVDVQSNVVVPGDVILLEAGMKVPADAILFSAKNLVTDESLLTGESLPVEKSIGSSVFAGTLVVKGSGKAVVIATGENTELGRIAKSVRIEEGAETPLIRRTKRLSKLIFFCCGFCIRFELRSRNFERIRSNFYVFSVGKLGCCCDSRKPSGAHHYGSCDRSQRYG